MPGFISDRPLARELVRIGDEAIAAEDGAKLRAYFREDYVFHGPGADLGFDELSAYFASLRAAFGGLRSSVSRSSSTATAWRMTRGDRQFVDRVDGGQNLSVICPATKIAASGSIMSSFSQRNMIVAQEERLPFAVAL
jgi:hypothetical protein